MNRTLQRGFTLVEMLVVAPIVILAIGAFLTVIINMTGEVLASRASNTLSYTVQDALNRIEQDVKQSSSFLATNTVTLPAANAQGYNDDATAFTNVGGTSNTSIILNMVATTGNPISTSSGYVYLKNKPNACASAQGVNTPFTYNVVYFTKVDPVTNISNLWRRTVMPTTYTDTTNTVCALPYQQPSCSPTYMDANTATATYCKTNDIKLVEGVASTDFIVQYFSGESASTVNDTATNTSASTPDRNTALQSATTTRVSITAKQTAAGRDVERAASLRVSRLDTNASSIAVVTTDGVPAAPTVTSKLSGTTDVSFVWPKVPGATTYTMQFQRNGGAWTAGTTNSTALGYTVTGNNHKDVINARVTAINAAGTSGYGTNAFTVPLWAPMNLAGSWSNYSQPYATAAYTKTSAGVIFLKGLVRSGSGVIANLPAGYRPAKYIMFQTSSLDVGVRVDVYPDGNVVMVTGNNGWYSLDGIAFMPASTTYTAPTFQNGWINHDATWQSAGYMTDSLGRVQLTGLVRAGTYTSGTPIFTLPAGSRPSEYMHVLNDMSDTVAHFGVDAAGNVAAKGYGNGYHSLQYMFYPAGRATGTTCTTQWCALPLQNGWTMYGGTSSGFGSPQYTKSADGIVLLKGLVSSGSTPQAIIATLPAGYCPKERLLMATISNNAYSRLDVIRQADGSCQLAPQTGSSTVWFSLDDLRFIAES